jgi:hypothetical protein
MHMTSQAFRTALHIPLTDPVSGNVVQIQVPGENYISEWSSASGLPEAPQDGELYARKDATWVVVRIDCGQF